MIIESERSYKHMKTKPQYFSTKPSSVYIQPPFSHCSAAQIAGDAASDETFPLHPTLDHINSHGGVPDILTKKDVMAIVV